jgi:LPXTG-site transpeptidase (sortase) family protein
MNRAAPKRDLKGAALAILFCLAMVVVFFLLGFALAGSAGAATRQGSEWQAFLNIPSIGLRERVTMDVDAGPAFWPVTGRPGGGDTIAIAGHRTTHTHPFYSIDRLRRGNRIYVRYLGRMRAYVVTGHRVLDVRHMHIADARGHEVLILTACARSDGSPTSAQYRIAVYALPA